MSVIRREPERIAVAAAVVVAAAAVSVAFPDNMMVMGATSAVAAIIVTILLVSFGPLTLSERWRRRRQFRRPLRARNMLYSTAGNGTVWDGECASMYVAIAPAPFQVSVIDVPDPELTPPSIPFDLIRDYLVQGDIHLAEANVLGFAYRRFGRGDYNDSYHRAVGETSMAAIISTVIEIKVNLAASLYSVQARSPEGGSIPAAVGSTVHVVAARLEQALNMAGYEAKLLKGAEVNAFDASMLASLNDGLLHEQWNYLGGDTPAVVTRPSEWTHRASQRWLQVRADRVATAFSIRPGNFSTETVSGALAFVYPDAAQFPEKAQYLRRVAGNQGNVATELLPLARTVRGVGADQGALELAQDEAFPLEIPATGLGVHLGDGLQGGRVFLNMQTGGAVLYVDAPLQFVACLIARASAVGASVGIRMDEPEWSQLAATVNPSLIAIHPTTTQSLEVYRDHAPTPSRRSATIVWCPGALPPTAVYTLAMEEDFTARVATPDGVADFRWTVGHDELALLPAAVRTGAVI